MHPSTHEDTLQTPPPPRPLPQPSPKILSRPTLASPKSTPPPPLSLTSIRPKPSLSPHPIQNPDPPLSPPPRRETAQFGPPPPCRRVYPPSTFPHPIPQPMVMQYPARPPLAAKIQRYRASSLFLPRSTFTPPHSRAVPRRACGQVDPRHLQPSPRYGRAWGGGNWDFSSISRLPDFIAM